MKRLLLLLIALVAFGAVASAKKPKKDKTPKELTSVVILLSSDHPRIDSLTVTYPFTTHKLLIKNSQGEDVVGFGRYIKDGKQVNPAIEPVEVNIANLEASHSKVIDYDLLLEDGQSWDDVDTIFSLIFGKNYKGTTYVIDKCTIVDGKAQMAAMFHIMCYPPITYN